MKILVIEDEPEMRTNLVSALQEESYVVETAADYDAANEKLWVYEYDCILLDIGLPGGSGLQLLRELKSNGKESGVIIVSARGSIEDKVKGLDLGADDYLAKPFHMAELHARVKSVIRRKTLGGNPLVTVGNLAIDTEQRTVTVNQTAVPFNKKEFDILLYLVVNRDRLVSKTALAEHVWGDYIDETNSFDFIYSQIRNIRKKLKDLDAGLEINAVYGIGYKLTAP